mgnify:FL=1
MIKNYLEEKYNLLRPVKTNELVRLGRNMVGGYIVDLGIVEKTKNLITLGFGPEWSFESDFLKIKNNCSVYIYDHKLSSIPYFKNIWKYIRRFLLLRTSYHTLKNEFDVWAKYKSFFNHKNVQFYNEKVNFPIEQKNETDIKKILSRVKDKSKVIFKIDIQSFEYKIIDQLAESSDQINMMAIQFYWIDKNEETFIDSIKKLKHKFEIIHIHANNHHDKLKNGLPIMLEITFLNSRFVTKKNEFIKDFPIKDLDCSSHPAREDISFSFAD